MKHSVSIAILTSTLCTATLAAATIDMKDPRRAVGREDDVRVDAQLLAEDVSSGRPISVTYQVQNFSRERIAIAPKVASASYDADEQTITVGIGSEIPTGGVMPQLVTIEPGEKKTFTVAASATFVVSNIGSRFAVVPRYVRVKVSVLRNVSPFIQLIERQQTSAPPPQQHLDDQQFNSWIEANETIFLNTIPVRYTPGRKHSIDAESRGVDASSF